MSDRPRLNVVLINRAKLKTLIQSYVTDGDHPLAQIFLEGKRRIEAVLTLPGCKCKHGRKRNEVYDDILLQLRHLTLTEIEPLKAHLNATTLNLGKGHQI